MKKEILEEKYRRNGFLMITFHQSDKSIFSEKRFTREVQAIKDFNAAK